MKLKVLDLSRVLAGPICGMILGDLGADVIKVERPGSGDETRGYGPPFDERGESAYFLSINRNKKSIALELSDPRDRDFLLELIKEADVVIDNFLPGKLNGFGIDPSRLLEENPKLIWCSISGFGPDSPRPGYDFVTQAEAGWMSVTGDVDGEPMKVGFALADVGAGKDAAIAILAAVAERKDGTLSVERRRIHISLMASAVASLVNVAQGVLVSGKDADRWGNSHPNLVPYQIFNASDRPIVIAVGSDSQWQPCARSLGLEQLAVDPELLHNAGRVRNRERVVSAIASAVKEKSAAEWISLLRQAGVPSGEVKTVRESLKGCDASRRDGIPSAVGGTVRFPPPLLDEHGAELRTSGWRAFTA